ncbi:N-acetylglucosamine-6-phosphate deacetylase, partial [Aureobasidium melanogenum]
MHFCGTDLDVSIQPPRAFERQIDRKFRTIMDEIVSFGLCGDATDRSIQWMSTERRTDEKTKRMRYWICVTDSKYANINCLPSPSTSSDKTNRSASASASRDPLMPSNPSILAGVTVTALTASGILAFDQLRKLFTQSNNVAQPPAILSVPSNVRFEPFLTMLSPLVQLYVPSGRPARLMASVTKIMPSGCAAYAILTVVGCRCMPSAMTPKKGVCVEGWPRMPKTPGFLCGYSCRCFLIRSLCMSNAEDDIAFYHIWDYRGHVSDFRSGRQFFDVGQIVNTVTSFEIGERCGRL